MLYICIFSNKFDLKQTIRVLHTKLNIVEGTGSCLKPSQTVFETTFNINHTKEYQNVQHIIITQVKCT